MSLLLLQACAGSSAPSDDTASGPFSYTSFENGSLDEETGSIADDDLKPLRSMDLIPLSDLITAQVKMEYRVRCFAYDKSRRFLGASDGETVILSDTIQALFPACDSVKLLVESPDRNSLDPASLDEYGLIVRVRSEYSARTPVKMEIGDVAGELDGKEIQSLTIYLEKDPEANSPLLLSCSSGYQSESGAYPTIQMSLLDPAGNARYTSPAYRLGSSGEKMTENTWRLPPYQLSEDQFKITILLPEDVVLSVGSMDCRADTHPDARDEILYHAAQGFSGLYAPSTMRAFWMAGELGFESCVATPRFTADNVCVCFQDTDSVRERLRYSDGSEIEAGGPDDRPISRFTYDELIQLDAGVKTSTLYAKDRVPSLEQFFGICAQYDMAPVLSIPSDRDYMYGSGRRHFSDIRDLAEQCGVLSKLRIQSDDSNVLQAALSVFGQDTAGYIVAAPSDVDWDPLALMKTVGFAARSAEGMQESEYSVVLEYPLSASDETLRAAMDAGFPVSVETTAGKLSGPDLEHLIELGVTEFTVDTHCSIGLNW